MSSSMPLQPSWMTLSTSMFTSVVKTMHLLALQLGRVVDLAHRLVGLVHGVDEGQAHVAGRHSNCARMALPKVSAVMPVPSETKNTVRVCI
jgi:hypothetical protein